MEQLLLPSPLSAESKRKTITDRRGITRLLRTLILLPPCILIGLIGALLLSCPERRIERTK